MAIPVHLQQFKAAGIYRIVWDKSTIVNQDTAMIRLVVGYSEKGPFNIPVYVKDTADFIAHFGPISKKLEKRGVFFHRMALEMLKVSPILCLNLKKFSGETVDGATISTEFNPKFDPIDSVKLRIEDVYTTTRFWELDAQKLNDLTTATGSKMSQYINISQTSEKSDSVTYFIRKASGSKVAGYNITVNDWYSDESDNLPEYLENRKGDLISDYFAEVYVFKGKFETAQVLSSTNLKNYFDVEKNPLTGDFELKLKQFYLNAFGEAQDTLDTLYADSTSNAIGHYVGALIPYFKDKQGVYAALDIVFNNDIDLHHLMMSFNEDSLEEGLVNINLSGRDAIIADSCTDSRLINAVNALSLDKIYYGVAQDQKDENGRQKYYSNQEDVDAFNAQLEGAAEYMETLPKYSQTEAYAYNANLLGAAKLGDNNLTIGYGEDDWKTPEEYNSELDDAAKLGDTIMWTEEDKIIYNKKAAMMGIDQLPLNVEVVKFELDTQLKVDDYNAGLDAALKEGDVAYDFSLLKDVNRYNETLPGAKHAGETKDISIPTWTEDAAAIFNAGLEDAVKIGDDKVWDEATARKHNDNLPAAHKLGDEPEKWTKAAADEYNLKSLKKYAQEKVIEQLTNAYSFDSYSDAAAENAYAQGIAIVVEQTSENNAKIKIIANSVSEPNFVGEVFEVRTVQGNLQENTIIQLYKNGEAQSIWVKVTKIDVTPRSNTIEWEDTDVKIAGFDWTGSDASYIKYDFDTHTFDIASNAVEAYISGSAVHEVMTKVAATVLLDSNDPSNDDLDAYFVRVLADIYDQKLKALRLSTPGTSDTDILAANTWLKYLYIGVDLIKFEFNTIEKVQDYNDALDDAVHPGQLVDTSTMSGVNAYNASLAGAHIAGVKVDVNSKQDVSDYNSTLTNAAKIGDKVVYIVPANTKLLGNMSAPIISEVMTIGNSLYNDYNEFFYGFKYNGKNKDNVSIKGSFYVSDICYDEAGSTFDGYDNETNTFTTLPKATFKEIGDGNHEFTVEFDPTVVVYLRGKQYIKFLKDCGVYVEVVSEFGGISYVLDKELTTTMVYDDVKPYETIENTLDIKKKDISFKNGTLKQFISNVYRLSTVNTNSYEFADPKGIATAAVNDISFVTRVHTLHEANNDNVKNNVYGASLSFIYIENTAWEKKTGVLINAVVCDVLASEEDSLQHVLSVGDYLLANDGSIDVNDDGILDAKDKDSYYDVVQVQEMGTYVENGKKMYYIKLTGMPKLYTPGQGDGTTFLVKYNGGLNQEIGTMKPLYLEGYTFANSRPTGVSMYAKLQWQKDILETLQAYRGLRTALLNKSEIDYRYVIDTFESFPSESLKVELAALCKEKQSAFCIANFPSVKSFVKCPYTSFTDKDGNFNVQYVVDGMNKKKAASIKFSLPSDYDGASFIAFYSPLKFSDGYVDNIVPSAAHVSNLFVEKYMSRQPYYIVAGPNYGSITGAGLVGPDYRYSRDELQIIEPFGVNVMVYRPNFGTFINANQTAKQTPVSALSKVHVRELVIYLQDEIEKVLQQYQWEFNNARTRNAILDKANSICELVMANGGLQAYRNIMDESNNTPDIIDNEMAVISTHIEPGMGCGKMVQELTLYRTGKMTAALSDQ